MSITDHARTHPDKPATVMARSGAVVTYAELEERSIRLARLLRTAGLRPGDVVALFMENNPRYHEVYWAAVRSGMYLCAVNKYLTADEAEFIVNDSGARALVTSAALGSVAAELVDRIPVCTVRLAVDGPVAGFDRYEDEIAGHSDAPLDEEPLGDFMNYSSGTTGRPKGIKRPLSGSTFDEPSMLGALIGRLYGIDAATTYLSPAPLYHSAPLAWTAAVHSWGGTNVIMESFDPAEALALIETHRVTHAQWVPTMFVRMLKLPEEERRRHDLSSMTTAVHAAAPCPIEVKREMIDWWGPIIVEYYGGTEVNGLTLCTSEEWLAHQGTVGKAILGTIHICDETGAEVAHGTPGIIYFERDAPAFTYHNDEAKTRAAEHPDHPLWTKLGDIGYIDDEGYLYLTDRESFMIISGGVNIYPQEIEDVLVMHPAVQDVAVIGVPNADLGEEVKAVVQLVPGQPTGEDVIADLLAYARARLAAYKVPRSIDLVDELPRQETGKLYKRLLRDRYWGNRTSRIV
jgi:long-chain acyl-CoA synthetase